MPSTRPNILLITSDQQHPSAMGCVNPALSTPAIDRLATEGTRFDRAYCNNPTCSPSRSSIITGMYPAWHGCWALGTKLDEDQPVVGDDLTRAGYATHLVGKAHFQPLARTREQESLECQPVLRDLDYWRDFTGPWYGFQRVELARNHGHESHVGQHYAIWLEEKGLEDWADYFMPLPGGEPGPHCPPRRPRGQPRPRSDRSWDLPDDLHYSTWTAERTIANIEAAVTEGRPFFTWASFHDPHPPYIVPEPFASMYDPADMRLPECDPADMDDMPPAHREAMKSMDDADFTRWLESGHNNHGFHSHRFDPEQLKMDMACYYGMISLMDREIGRILDALDRLGVAENTIVVFTTDHGHFLGHHGLVAKGAFHYEDLVRLPFVARWPGRIPAGEASEALIGLLDLAPTFMDAAGLGVPGRMQGVSQLDVWTGKAASAREMVICENRHQPTRLHLRTYIDSRYKLTLWRGCDYGELFDLQEDPDERRNLWSSPDHQNLKAHMMEKAIQEEMRREPTRYPRIAVA